MKTHKGGCHCGAVTYEVKGDFTEGMSCNCSHCRKKGFLMTFVPESDFTLLSGEDNLTTYQFNKKQIDHKFCKTCGVQSFGRGHDGDGNYMIMINLNCLEDFDIDSLTIKKVDGKNY